MRSKCIVCGGDIPESKVKTRKFDNKDCRNKYHNVKRYHPDWTDSEIIQYINQARHCLFCYKDLSDRRKDIEFCNQNCRRAYRRLEKKNLQKTQSK